MTDHNKIFQTLATFGADLSRWPQDRLASARRALLADPQFRRAWEAERDFELALTAHRDSLDQAVAASGALERVSRGALARCTAGNARATLGALPWRQVAAAMLVSGMLGGAIDLTLREGGSEGVDAASADILFSLDDPNVR